MAAELESENHLYSGALRDTMDCWRAALNRIWPAGFPEMKIYFPPRIFENVPVDLERHVLHLNTIAQEMQSLGAYELLRSEI